MIVNFPQFFFAQYNNRWQTMRRWVNSNYELRFFWEVTSQNGYHKIPVTAEGWAELWAIEGPIKFRYSSRSTCYQGAHASVEDFVRYEVLHQMMKGDHKCWMPLQEEDVDQNIELLSQRLSNWPERNWDWPWLLRPNLKF